MSWASFGFPAIFEMHVSCVQLQYAVGAGARVLRAVNILQDMQVLVLVQGVPCQIIPHPLAMSASAAGSRKIFYDSPP